MGDEALPAGPPRVLLYADLRTSHAVGWLAGLRSAGVEVHPLSSQIVDEPGTPHTLDAVARLRRVVVASGVNRRLRGWLADRATRVDPLQILETTMTPLRLRSQTRRLREEINQFKPDLVHALRLPYEGLTALTAVRDRPVVVSSWGQDFMMQAALDPLLRRWLTRTLPAAAGLHVDTEADLERAGALGFPTDRPILHAAGNFGVDRSLFFPEHKGDTRLVVYPRGLRRYVNHRVFLHMAESCRRPDLRFVGVGLRGDPESEKLAAHLAPGVLILTDELPREDFAHLLRGASVVVSPATSDGTPNSVLEALACGAYVMAGHIPGMAQLLASPALGSVLDPTVAGAWSAELTRITDTDTLSDAPLVNPRCVAPPYDRVANQQRVVDFYSRVAVASWRTSPHSRER